MNWSVVVNLLERVPSAKVRNCGGGRHAIRELSDQVTQVMGFPEEHWDCFAAAGDY